MTAWSFGGGAFLNGEPIRVSPSGPGSPPDGYDALKSLRISGAPIVHDGHVHPAGAQGRDARHQWERLNRQLNRFPHPDDPRHVLCAAASAALLRAAYNERPKAQPAPHEHDESVQPRDAVAAVRERVDGELELLILGDGRGHARTVSSAGSSPGADREAPLPP